jgi:DNA invertase Pin-like site-specific DNA recombinase
VAAEYVDQASGTSEERTHYKRMIAAAKKRQLDAVLVRRYDRFARSTQALVNALKEFQSLGVDFISYQENIDTTTPTGELIFHVMASLAQFESALISQRVRAGMARAKAQGRVISRPPLPQSKQQEIARLHATGVSIHQISKQTAIAYGTVYKYVQALKAWFYVAPGADDTTNSSRDIQYYLYYINALVLFLYVIACPSHFSAQLTPTTEQELLRT